MSSDDVPAVGQRGSGQEAGAEFEVLVVGAGPVGLTAAYELRRRGVAVRVVDRAPGPAVTSRATATHARTLEIYHQIGIIDDILPRGQRAEHFTMYRAGHRLIRMDTEYSTLPTRYPFTLQVDQVITEEVLRTRLQDQGVEVEWGIELEKIDPGPDRVAVTLRHRDGLVEQVTAPWLIGADGGHSTVREQLGFTLLGSTTETWLIADAVVDGAELPRDSLHWMHVGNGTIMLVPFPDPGKWRLLDTVDVADADDYDAVADRFAAKISRAIGRRVTVRTPSWVSVFTIQQRMIQQMRSGRCFVAGDAAHVHSPASGQGLNTGIHDACNLAWKLAEVIRGRAGDALLDTYGAERLPVGEVLLESTRTATALIALRNAAAPVVLPVGLRLLNTVKPLKRKIERKLMTAMSGLALNYAQSPLTRPDEGVDDGRIRVGHRVACSTETERRSPGWRAMCAELTDPRWTLLAFAGAVPLPRATADALAGIDRGYGDAVSVRTVSDGAAGGGPQPLDDPGLELHRSFRAGSGRYALVRPDGYLAATGALGDAEHLASVLTDLHFLPGQLVTGRAE